MRLLPPLLVALTVLAACGGDDDDATNETPTIGVTASESPATAEPSVTATLAPPEGASRLPPGVFGAGETGGTAIEPGTYYTGAFKPRVVFTLGDGWGNAGERARGLLLLRRPEPSDIAFSFDSTNSTAEDVDLTVSRFTSIAGTEPGEVTETTVGGHPAKEFDLAITDSRVEIPRLDQPYVSLVGDRLHFWIVDVDGATVKLIAEAPSAEWDAYALVAQEVVDSMRFE
jgi:hypothetical protein